MAKNAMPVSTGGGSKVLPKLISTLLAVSVLVLVVKHPTESASNATALMNGIGSAIDALATFLNALG